jgi:hypothetical protein
VRHRRAEVTERIDRIVPWRVGAEAQGESRVPQRAEGEALLGDTDGDNLRVPHRHRLGHGVTGVHGEHASIHEQQIGGKHMRSHGMKTGYLFSSTVPCLSAWASQPER